MRAVHTGILALIALSVASCGGGGDPPTGGDTILVVVTPSNPTVRVGNTVQLRATVNGPAGIPQGVTWRSITPDLVSVTGSGLVTGLMEGEGRVRAAWSADQEEFTDVYINVITAPVGEDRVGAASVLRKTR